MENKNRHGGRRTGAGRPSVLKEPSRITITLEKSQLDWLKAKGNPSEIIRHLIYQKMFESDEYNEYAGYKYTEN